MSKLEESLKKRLLETQTLNKRKLEPDANEKKLDEIIDVFEKHTEKVLNDDKRYRTIFFFSCVGIMILVTITMILTVYTILSYHWSDNNAQVISGATTAVVSFASTFWIIPKTIAKYLFSSNTQDSLVTLAKQIYDKKETDIFS